MLLAPERIITSDVELISFDTATGAVEWKLNYDQPIDLTADQKKLYIVRTGRPLEAYNLETGDLVWSSHSFPERRPYFLNIQQDTLFISSNLGLTYSFDAETGALLTEEVDNRFNDVLVMRWHDFDLRYAYKDGIQMLLKIRRENGEVIWQTKVDVSVPDQFPLLSNNKLILISGQRDMTLYAVDFNTGQLLWQSKDPFVSHPAVSQGKVYALRKDARLMILDETSGTEIGYIQFTPEETPWATYWVGADEQGRIFVYFSDSQELFALAVK
jgi:outer membrane protein assembly factor BamB